MAKSLQTEFVKYYREKLEPLGFKKVKGRQPYFVRVINDEILHVFTFRGAPSIKYEDNAWHDVSEKYKVFRLMFGVATVYRKEINFKATPRNNCNWLICLDDICDKVETELPVSRMKYYYYYNDENIEDVIKAAYDGAKKLLDILDKVSSMEEAFKFIRNNYPQSISFTRHMLEDDSYSDAEGLFFARKEYDNKKIEKHFADMRLELKNSLISSGQKKIALRIDAMERGLGKNRLKFINNDEDYQKGMELLKKHYNDNVDSLRKLGLDIQKKDLDFLG